MATAAQYEAAFHNAIKLVKEVLSYDPRQSVKFHKLRDVLANKSDWKRLHDGGHHHYVNIITGQSAGLQGHSCSKKDSTIKHSHLPQFQQAIRDHLEKLADKLQIKVAQFNHSTQPDFTAAALADLQLEQKAAKLASNPHTIYSASAPHNHKQAKQCHNKRLHR